MSDDNDYMNTICDFYRPPKEEKEPETITLGTLVFTKVKGEPRCTHGIGQSSHTTQRYYSGQPFHFWMTSRIEFNGTQMWSVDEGHWHESPKEALLYKKKRALAHFRSLSQDLINAERNFKDLEAALETALATLD